MVVGERKQVVVVTIDAEGSEVQVEPVKIEEDLRGGKLPTRLGLQLVKPTAHATISLMIGPAESH